MGACDVVCRGLVVSAWAELIDSWLKLRRFMQPATPHFVITIEDALAIGGHFYSSPTMELSVRGLLLEHFFGSAIVNAAYPPSPIALMKLLDYLVDVLDPKRHQREVRNEVKKHIRAETVVLLCVLIQHIKQIGPEIPKEGENDFNTEYWIGEREYDSDFQHASELVQELIKLCATEDFLNAILNYEQEFISMATAFSNIRRKRTAEYEVKLKSLANSVQKAIQGRLEASL